MPKPKDTPTAYEKQLRKAMLAVEDICGDTDAPMRARLHAIRRIRDFCEVILDEFDPKPKEQADA
jgi:hypothetical protein